MEFRVLGAMELGSSQTTTEVPGVLQRTLLAALLLAQGRVLLSGPLIDELWGERLPADPQAALCAQVARLRRTLEAQERGGRRRLEHRTSGYRLHVLEGELDLAEFRRLRRQAQLSGSPQEAEDLMRQSLALWRGPALADVRPHSQCEAAGLALQDAREQSYVELFEFGLRIGRAGEISGDIEELTLLYPLNEALYEQLMRALILSGRRVSAIAVYQRARRCLAELAGLDLSPALGRCLAQALADSNAPESGQQPP
ncbi:MULTISPECIES: AfsR/SARP family transcriptional regulator [unclassified Streptomyces]|uniref:AfsR/SARP family transcriptional regulator n=1 Tax=unclassified Streptomyces TaxID=2593676 RepID=UPI000BF0D015|nr:MULTISPECIES: BTAD domain-containing putative transcriptional regulator [unclassified Streptomyces]